MVSLGTALPLCVVIVPLRSSVIKTAGDIYECVSVACCGVTCPIHECVDKCVLYLLPRQMNRYTRDKTV